jgi:hypothetical protein
MPDEKDLIPVFDPPLANILAMTEKKKGAPLETAEVESVRDRSTCIMMPRADSEKMSQARGFVDVNPKNAWADWHRLRSQMVGGYLPRLVLCIPGNDDFRRQSEPVLTAEKLEYEFRGRDPRLVNAFRASSITWPAFTPSDFTRIETHSTVLYVLSEIMVPAKAPLVARQFLHLGRRLLDAGGIAIKSESSGISHPAERWTRFDTRADVSDHEKWVALFLAYVVHPIGTDAELYTCGMHLLGAPDLIVSGDAIAKSMQKGQTLASTAAELFRNFGIYLLSECQAGAFISGHTFSTVKDSPRYRVVWEPCDAYPQDSYFHNSFGRWRLKTP